MPHNIFEISVRLPDFFYEINIFSVTFRLFLAVIIGGVIGKERGKNNQTAGFRTHILVCSGAALAMMTNQYIVEYMAVGSDPARLGAQVITGVGFLGVGTILVTGKYKIKGLTTAAGLWASACVGLALGIGFYLGGIATGIIIYICLTLFRILENRMYGESLVMAIYIEVEVLRAYRDTIAYLREKNVEIYETISDNSEKHIVGTNAFIITLKANSKEEKELLIKEIEHIEGVFMAYRM